MTVQELQALLVEHDDGVLKGGSHSEGSREFCALEFESIVRGRPFSDLSITLPDLRPLNDAFGMGDIADAARTTALLPVMAALWDWSHWSPQRQQKWIERVVISTIQNIISSLPALSDANKRQCEAVVTLHGAKVAAMAARAAGAAVAAMAAGAALAAKTRVVATACHLWVSAADETIGL